MFKYIKNSVSIAVLLLALPFTGAAKKNLTVDLNSFKSHGTNAIDYVLQKPLPADTFPAEQQGFGKHIFFAAKGGISALSNSFSGRVKPGLHITGEVGSWFTPVHGIRIGGEMGYMSVHPDIPRGWYGSLQADYLLNVTNLLKGYTPDRKFELLWSMGLDMRLIRQRGGWHADAGLATALQARFNVGPSLYLLAEPRLAMFTGYNYSSPTAWNRLYADFSFNIGLGYRILTGSLRKKASTDCSIIKDDDLYFGAGAGIWGFPRQGIRTFKNPFGTAFMGKQFSSVSALQLNLSFDQYRQSKTHSYFAIGSLDYVFNLGNVCSGYHPESVFQTLINVGVAGAGMAHYGNGHLVSPGLSFGVTGLFRLTENWGLYVHPQAYVFTRKFSTAVYGKNCPITALDFGVRYTLGDFSRLQPESYETYNAEPRHWFISAGIGAAGRLRSHFGSGADAFVGFGKRFTPISSWRVQVIGAIFPKGATAVDATIHLDYLSSITTAMYGYDPERLFDLQMVLGAFAGVGQYDAGARPTIGLTGGLQFNFRLNKHLDIYFEPQFLAQNVAIVDGAHGWIPELRAQLGLRYKLGSLSGTRGSLSETPYGEQRNFVSLGAGPTVFSGAITSRGIHPKGGLDVAVGRWFSRVSALRLTYANDWFSRDGNTYYIGSLHLDYMLNVTSLIDGDPDRRFHILGVVGAGLGVSPDAKRKASGMAYGGVQFRYNLPWNIDVHIEPGVNAWPNRLIPNPVSLAHFEACGRLIFGASYRF